jgi:hypothetical protein
MSVTPSSTNVTVGQTASVIVTVDDFGSGSGDGRITYQILNNGNDTLYLGDSELTTSNGMPIPAGGTMAINMRLGSVLYAISDGISQDIRIMKVN